MAVSLRSRVVLLLTTGVVAAGLSLAAPAQADPLPHGNEIADDCRADGQSERTCKGVEAFFETGAHACREFTDADANSTHDDCAQIDGQNLDPAQVDAWQDTTLKRALDWQRKVSESRPLGLSQVVGTHNSFNSRAYDFTLSGTDSNHLLTMYDQMRMGMRTLELDIHWIPSPHQAGYEIILCHANTLHSGCTVESQTFADGLDEVRRFLDENPDQFVILELQNELHDFGQPAAVAHERAVDLLEASFPGSQIYQPGDPDGNAATCADVPLTTSIDQMRATGARVVVFSQCGNGAGLGGWNDLVFSNDNVRFQSGLGDYDYTYDTGCQRFGTPAIDNWTRSWDDTTFLSTMVDGDDWVADETVISNWVDCGLNMANFDDIAAADHRMAALLWSWADGVEPFDGLVRHDADGRWVPADWSFSVACRTPDGWQIAWSMAGEASEGGGDAGHPVPLTPDMACARIGGSFSPPATGYENRQLLEITGGAEHVIFASA